MAGVSTKRVLPNVEQIDTKLQKPTTQTHPNKSTQFTTIFQSDQNELFQLFR